MKSIEMEERPNYRGIAIKEGFTFPDMYGQKYWDESHAYEFTLEQIENDIEDPTTELVGICYDAVNRITADSQKMTALQIPAEYHYAVRQSWVEKDKDLYGRFDLSYGGDGHAKMLEFNADTPTSLYESSVFQWQWMEQMKADGKLSQDVDQFNSIHEKLLKSFQKLNTFRKNNTFHFAAVLESPEDALTAGYLADCAFQAGFSVNLMDIENIGADEQGNFYDEEERVIKNLFKLYPLESMFREQFGPYLTKRTVNLFEPLWKSVLSNKGILPFLWDFNEGHPNLLPAYFADEKDSIPGGYVKKPLFSREGQNIEIHAPETNIVTDGEYGEEGHIIQAFHPLPKFGDSYAVIGSWVVGGEAAGIGIREDDSLVTRNLSRFVPHYIKG